MKSPRNSWRIYWKVWVENFRDLTKHEGLWGRLRKERNKAQQYLNIACVNIIAINEKGVVTLINKKGCEILGLQKLLGILEISKQIETLKHFHIPLFNRKIEA